MHGGGDVAGHGGAGSERVVPEQRDESGLDLGLSRSHPSLSLSLYLSLSLSLSLSLLEFRLKDGDVSTLHPLSLSRGPD